jgi:hypothetical protein
MKDFYTDILGLESVSEEKDRSVFPKAGQSMLLIINPSKTLTSSISLNFSSESFDILSSHSKPFASRTCSVKLTISSLCCFFC